MIPPIQNTGAGGAVMKSLSSVNRTVYANDFKNIGVAFLGSPPNAPPRSVDDIARDIPGRAVTAIKDGTFIIFWGANPNLAPAGASRTILGYVKDVPEKGGVVLLLDGTTPTITAQEFKAMAKAGK